MKILVLMALLFTSLLGQNLLNPEEIIGKIQAQDINLYPKIQNSLHLYLSSDDPRLRESVMVALAQIPLGSNEIKLLTNHLSEEKKHSIRASILKLLEPHVINRDDLKELVASMITEPFEGDDAVAAEICGRTVIPQATERLMAMAKDPNFANGGVALETLSSGYLLLPSFYEWLRTAEVVAQEETENVKDMMSNYPADYLKSLIEGTPSFRFQQAAVKILSETNTGRITDTGVVEETDESSTGKLITGFEKEADTTNECEAPEGQQQSTNPFVQSTTLPHKLDLKWPALFSIILCLISFFVQKHVSKFYLRLICAYFLCLLASFIFLSQDLFPRIDDIQSFILLRKITFNLVWPAFYLSIIFIFIALPVYLWIPQIVRNLPTILRGVIGMTFAVVVTIGFMYDFTAIDPFLPASVTCGFIIGFFVPVHTT